MAKSLVRWFALVTVMCYWGLAATDVSAQENMPPVYYHVDATGNQSVEQLLDKEPSFWSVLNNGSPSFGYTSATYWFHFKLPAVDYDRVIRIGYPLLDNVDVYFVTDNEIIKRVRLGDAYEFDQRPVDNRNFVVPVASRDRVEVFLRVNTTSSMRVPLSVWQPTDLMGAEQALTTATGMYFGLLLCMIVYNLFSYSVTRDRRFGYYSAYIVGIGLLLAGLDGTGYQYLWPWSEWLQSKAIPLFGSMVFLFASLVASQVLQTKLRSPKLHMGLQGIMIAAVLLFVASIFLPYEWMISVVLSVAILASSFLIFTGLTLWHQGLAYARIYSLALSVLLLAIIINAIGYLGFLESFFIQRYMIMIGSAIEIMLLSLVLAIRFNEDRKERLAAEQRLNSRLEVKVKQRTKELEALMRKLKEMNQRLEVKSSEDRLTKLFNRGVLDDDLPLEVRRARRTGYDIAVVMIDIDHFKKVNDKFGHPVGDEVLVELARLLRVNFRRAGDRIYRYGGEEFVILMPGAQELGCHDKVLTFTDLIRGHSFHTERGEVKITVSVGMALLNSLPGHASSKQLLEAADNALYQAKNAGRDQIRIARSAKDVSEKP
ncbi:diguanylate cyclase [Pseudidiomarina sp. 1ASP75-14]|uniref:sensor domain-containing diguanylate cyclase n=1 Tax=Pseudidiomarina terrestris TaxID=2820060 RepID=UPI00264DFE46|nr:sensor domain-containing diguanylate cyclase [Pseudidiomarina sp. 1ASP75-14]MDN7138171.1 diguanylate cyclase [Pseudidiomarina sp. 1ASP75-14]